MTLLSRITGLARDIAFSAWFGSGPVMDAFTVAFKIPNLMRRFFAEGAFSQAFVPVISEYRTHRSHAETRELVGHVRARSARAVRRHGRRSRRGAGPGPRVCAGLRRRRRAVRARRRHAAFHVPVHAVRLVDGARGQRAERAPAVRRRGVHARAAERRHDHVRRFIGPLLERPELGLAAGVFVAGIVQLAFQLPFLQRLDLLPRPRWACATRVCGGS